MLNDPCRPGYQFELCKSFEWEGCKRANRVSQRLQYAQREAAPKKEFDEVE
jgi:hypothetical protein